MSNVDDWPVYVIEFSKETRKEDIAWLIKFLTDYGLQLNASTPSPGHTLKLFVYLTNERIFSVAKKCRVRTIDGQLLFDNPNGDSVWADDLPPETNSSRKGAQQNDARALFTPADILWMTRHEIDNVRSSTKQSLQMGDVKMTLFQGQSIVEKFIHKRLIEKMYPLHEKEELKRLCHDWLVHNPTSTLGSRHQSIDDMRKYFGEGVAFYFAFLETLTWALVVPCLIGLLHQFYVPADFYAHMLYCILYLIWSFSFMELWTRRSNGLSFLWGTKNKYGGGFGEPRANYRGALRIDPITGQLQPHYPRWKTLLKLYGASLPIVLICTLVAFWVMLESIWKETLLMEWTASWGEDGDLVWWLLAQGLVSIPTVIYAALVWVANQMYRKLATKLTEWENHRTESQFERNRVSKLLLFEFVNNFMSFFYIAFYMRDIKMLQWQVAMMLLVFQVINQLTETLWPYLNLKYILNKEILKLPQVESDEESVKMLQQLNVTVLASDHPRVLQAHKESLLEPYEGTHEDYLELFIQFGYVVLFVAAYPLAALWAFVNNVAELRVDAFKLLRIHRRPAPARVAHIGAWAPAFRMLCSMAVVTNCALLYVMSTPTTKPTNPAISLNTEAADSPTPVEEVANFMTDWTRAVICVTLDHILLAVQNLFSVVIPAVPRWVYVAAASRKAAQQKRLQKKQL